MVVRSESELVLCSENVRRVLAFESLECAASASLLYLKGGAYMTVESPTGGPNDVVQNNILYRHYGIAGGGDLIPGFPFSARENLPSGIAMPCLVETAPGRSLRRCLQRS